MPPKTSHRDGKSGTALHLMGGRAQTLLLWMCSRKAKRHPREMYLDIGCTASDIRRRQLANCGAWGDNPTSHRDGKFGIALHLMNGRVQALPAGGDNETRTRDLYVANVSLSQLSYTPNSAIFYHIFFENAILRANFFVIFSVCKDHFAGKQKKHLRLQVLLVGAGGFGPPKRDAADLQSVPFGHSGTLPNMLTQRNERKLLELVNGVEPSTC